VFDQDPRAGGMIWSQIPRFRLPMEVIDEEVGYILDLGVEFRGGTKIGSMKSCSRRTTTRSSSARARRAAATSTFRGAGSGEEHPYRHRLAFFRFLRPHRQDRQARDRAGRRQHRHGLLPVFQAAGGEDVK